MMSSTVCLTHSDHTSAVITHNTRTRYQRYKTATRLEKLLLSDSDFSATDFSDLTFTFTFNHLADAFIQSDVQMRRTIEAIRPSREQQYTSVMTSLS